MINIDVIYSTWLTNHVGPSKSLTRFKNHPSEFEKHGLNLRIITPDKIRARDFSQNDRKMISRLRSRAISFVVALSKYSDYLTAWVVERKYLSHSKRIIDYYAKVGGRTQVVVFHELFTAYYFVTSPLYDKQKHKIILYHHANGEIFKMLSIYYPRLHTSEFMKKLYEMEKVVLAHVEKFVFISNNARLNFLELNGAFPSEKTGFIYNGIEDLPISDRYKVSVPILEGDMKYKLVCAGTINDRKGQELLVRAVAKINGELRKELKFYILGNGPKKQYLQNLAVSLGVVEQFEFTGGVNNVEDYLSSSDIFVLPSKDEGLPISIIEAMRAGLPVIATSVAGIPEMIDHEKNGLLIQPTIESVASALSSLAEYDWQTMGKLARNTYEEKFTLQQMIKGYCTVIKNSLENS